MYLATVLSRNPGDTDSTSVETFETLGTDAASASSEEVLQT